MCHCDVFFNQGKQGFIHNALQFFCAAETTTMSMLKIMVYLHLNKIKSQDPMCTSTWLQSFEHAIADLSKHCFSIKTSSLQAIPFWLNLTEPPLLFWRGSYFLKHNCSLTKRLRAPDNASWITQFSFCYEHSSS